MSMNSNHNVDTQHWFPSELKERIKTALLALNIRGLLDIQLHDDNGKSMVTLVMFPSVSNPQQGDAKVEAVRFIQGFEAACTGPFVLPDYRVGSEGRSGPRVDQANRVGMPGDRPRNFHTVCGGAFTTQKAARAGVNLAFDGVHQFCKLNGLKYPEPQT